MKKNGFKIYFKNMIKPALGVAALQFVYLWGSYYNSQVYMNKPNMVSPVLLLKNMINGPAVPYYMLALIITLIPVAVLIIFAKIIISHVIVSKIR